MRAPNQYRLVYVRYNHASEMLMEDEPVRVKETGESRYIKTYTKWRSWNGQTIRSQESHEIEFRYKENA